MIDTARWQATYVMVDVVLRLAVVTFAGLLSLSAVGVFVWMAATRWTDASGTTVGVILMLLAGCQLAASVVWFRMQRTASGGSYVVSVERRKRDDDVDERKL